MASGIPDISHLSSCDYKEFVERVNSLTPESREELINVLRTNYFNSNNPIPFPDIRYDYVQGNTDEVMIGAPIEKKEEEVKLPTHLGSLDKVKTEKELKKFILNPSIRIAYGLKARKRAQAVHDIHIGAAKLAALYRDILS